MSYEFQIHTFGCKVNTYDTGLLQKRLEKAAQAPAQGVQKPLVHILNTCAVTAEATKEAVKLVRRLKAHSPLSTVVVTGCSAQVDGKEFDELPGVDLVVANSHKGQLESILDRFFKGTLESKVYRSNIFRKDDLEAGGGLENDHTRTFLKIQDGCNSFCTYCVIPFARGKSRSIPVAEIVSRISTLQKQGVSEVVLTGVHIGDYEDQNWDLSGLVAAVLEKTTLPRLRLSSLEPVELTPALLELYKNDRLCPHFHMSIQSANTQTLTMMKRHYNSEHVEQALMAIKSQLPQAFVGMDVIAGFPGETEDEFHDTYQRLERLPWTRLHVFPYSERPGTKASLMEQLPVLVRKQRAARLRELSLSRYMSMAQKQIGTFKRVMLLKNPARGAQGLSRDYWPVRFQPPPQMAAGTEAWVRIQSYDHSHASRMDGILSGEVVGDR